MLRKILVIYFSSFLIALPVIADDTSTDSVVTTVKKGETVPFDGTLFSQGAAAELIVKLENTDGKCKIEIQRQLDLQKAKFDLDTKLLQTDLDICQTTSKNILDIRQGQIDFLQQELTKTKKPSNELWFAIGIVGGVLITGAAAWSMNQISHH